MIYVEPVDLGKGTVKRSVLTWLFYTYIHGYEFNTKLDVLFAEAENDESQGYQEFYEDLLESKYLQKAYCRFLEDWLTVTMVSINFEDVRAYCSQRYHTKLDNQRITQFLMESEFYSVEEKVALAGTGTQKRALLALAYVLWKEE